MRLLIDSHALIWYVDQHQQLSPASHAAISDPANELLLSAGSIWEIAIKIGFGKLVLTQPYALWMSQVLIDLGITVLPITVEYADAQARLPKHHSDPFDRLIVAQAIVEKVSIVSADASMDAYGITRVW
ncbi:MAG TPA: type II toxin-antitoxin system VapC family toxin [Pyrinomonadaceae bacterium]